MLSPNSSLSRPGPEAIGGSPALLRLKLLEAKIAARRPMADDARASAQALIAALRRAIAERPSLSFADVVAKLKTCDELADDNFGNEVDDLHKALLKSALADLARIQPRA
ncbi:MAG TPA: hypothetical protein VMU18_03300 [Rhodoblastus sp.]|nr:hypothetical protein [Rhodoblastus sp.]